MEMRRRGDKRERGKPVLLSDWSELNKSSTAIGGGDATPNCNNGIGSSSLAVAPLIFGSDFRLLGIRINLWSIGQIAATFSSTYNKVKSTLRGLIFIVYQFINGIRMSLTIKTFETYMS